MGRYTGKKCRLITMFGLTASFFVVELVVGHVTNSMALIADSFHMLSDIAALIIAFVSVKMAPKSWDKNTYGWARAEVLGALVNAVFLVALCFSITMESLKRFYEPEEIHDPKMILVVGGLGLVVNLMGLCLFHSHGGGGHGHGHGHGHHGHSHDHGAHAHLAALANDDDDDDDDDRDDHCGEDDEGRSDRLGRKGLDNHRHHDHLADDGLSSSSRHPGGSGGQGQAGADVTTTTTVNTAMTSSASSTPVRSFRNSRTREGVVVVTARSASPEPPAAKKAKRAKKASNMNMQGVFLHVMADALGSVVVIISAVVMWQTDWEYKLYVDPGLSLVMVVLMLKSVWPLLIESALILLQTVPTHIDIDTLKRKLIQNVDGILAIHEFHVWQLAGDRIIASAHIRCLNLSEYMKMAENIKKFFHNEGIHSTTIQPEFIELSGPRGDGSESTSGRGESLDNVNHDDCVLSCPKDPRTQQEPDCHASKCCPPPKDDKAEPKSSQNTPVNARRRPNSLVSHESPPDGEGPLRSSYNFSTSTPVGPVIRSSSANKLTSSSRGCRTGGPGADPVGGHSKARARLDYSGGGSRLTSPATVAADLAIHNQTGRGDDFRIDLSQVSSQHHSSRQSQYSPGVVDLSSGRYDSNGLRMVDANSEVEPHLKDSMETSPMVAAEFTPRANSRVVKIVSKHSNV